MCLTRDASAGTEDTEVMSMVSCTVRGYDNTDSGSPDQKTATNQPHMVVNSSPYSQTSLTCQQTLDTNSSVKLVGPTLCLCRADRARSWEEPRPEADWRPRAGSRAADTEDPRPRVIQPIHPLDSRETLLRYMPYSPSRAKPVPSSLTSHGLM